ncbi:MAG: hypothetical protein JW863_12515 [Chitinispirillaceae bacterium]|nr:hypothetical protein [Chitinispirillaceae bacterium]
MCHSHAAMRYDRERLLRAVRIMMVAIAGVVFATVFALMFGCLVMLLWNWLIPSLFGLKTISYWQAFGVTILSKILFSGVHPPHRSPIHQRWHRERFKNWIHGEDGVYCRSQKDGFSPEEMRHYHSFWTEEGESAFKEYLRKKKADSDDGAATE